MRCYKALLVTSITFPLNPVRENLLRNAYSAGLSICTLFGTYARLLVEKVFCFNVCGVVDFVVIFLVSKLKPVKGRIWKYTHKASSMRI